MKDELLKKLEDAHQRLLKAIDLLPDDQKISTEWAKKEVLSHIAGWYEDGVSGTPKILKGEKPDSFRSTINGYNKRSVEKRKKMNVEKIREEMIALHKKWLAILQNLHEDEITSFYGTTLGKKPINVRWMIQEAIIHDNAHAEELEKLI